VNLLKTLALIATIPLLAQICYASKEVGNGGGSFVCRNADKQIQRAELLDIFEGRDLRTLPLNLGAPNEDFHAKIDRILALLAKVAPLRAKKYQELYKSFFDEADFMQGVDLVLIPDAENIASPTGCQYEQTAIQQEPQFPGDKRYFFNADIWDHLDGNSRAALILHEIIYREGIFWGQDNSKAVRYLVEVITSTEMLDMTEAKFTDLVFAAGFPTADMFGTLVTKKEESSSVSLSEDHSDFFKDVVPASLKPFPYQNFVLTRDFSIFLDSKDSHLLSASGAISYSYKLSKFTAANSEFDVSLNPDGSPNQLDAKDLSGDLGDWTLQSHQHLTLRFEAQGLPVWYYGDLQTQNKKTGYISPQFDPSSGAAFSSESRSITEQGVVLSGTLFGVQLLKTPQGPLRCLSGKYSSYMIQISDTGRIIQVQLDSNQTIKTAQGLEKIPADSKWTVKFLDDDLAQVVSKQ